MWCPTKLGTFESGGEAWLGLVLDDSLVVNIAEASAALGVKGLTFRRK